MHGKYPDGEGVGVGIVLKKKKIKKTTIIGIEIGESMGIYGNNEFAANM